VVGVEESDLIERARGGDQAAVEELLTRHEPRIYRFGLKMCRNPEDARDVVQETLLSAFRTLEGFRGASSFSTWLFAIVRSHCIKKRRRRRHEPDVVLSLDHEAEEDVRRVADEGERPDQRLERRRLRDALEKAIAGLGAGQREVLVLRDVEGLAAAEVAEVTGLSVQAVKSRLHRARMALREALLPALGLSAHETTATADAGCRQIVPLFSRHLEGEIAPETCRDLERHVASCPRCQEQCDALRAVLRLCRATPEPAVPDDVQRAVREGIRSFLAERA
jgi:RNA polymerase sigma-70 factor (ECF subfamily)